jgi:hypothetical protein
VLHFHNNINDLHLKSVADDRRVCGCNDFANSSSIR